MKKKVVVLGGGVAGMSAAHELAERGFEVHVYERHTIPGGKARSIGVPDTGVDGRKNLPGEHGFRFFPRFYRHVTDTMKRIPFGSNPQGVFDNLVQTTRIDIAEFDKAQVLMLSRFPHSVEDVVAALKSAFELDSVIGLKDGELELFASKLWQIITSCHQRRAEVYEKIGWWRFVEASTQSEAYQKFLAQGMTRSLVAADAQVANTKAEGDVGLQLIMDIFRPGISSDRVLNRPTNQAWINPWLDYLEQMGVQYHLNSEVVEIGCEDGEITGATIRNRDTNEEFEVTADYYIAAMPVEVMARFLTQDKHKKLLKADPTLHGIITLGKDTAWMNGIQFYLKEDVTITHGHAIYIDSPWALTSISQKQFWPEIDLADYGDGTVKGILSVDISDWNAPGILHKKPANQCTRTEIKEEVWEQLKRSLNTPDSILNDDNLHSWFLDPDIEDADRREPNRYEDAEPLFLALVNTWHLRPGAYTLIPNFFLASDYIRTNTQLATMEAANEAARRAVNSIIDASGADAEYCEIWKLHEPNVFAIWRWYDQWRYNRGLPWRSEQPTIIRWIQRLFMGGVSILERLQK